MPTHKKQYTRKSLRKSLRKSRPRKSRQKAKSRRSSRRGGGGGVKTWAQNARNSYMVRLKYALVPEGVQTDTRFVDTPYRFQSYQEARAYAKVLFPCYTYVVEGSRDPPTFSGYNEHDPKTIEARLKNIDQLQQKLQDKKAILLAQQQQQQQKNIGSLLI